MNEQGKGAKGHGNIVMKKGGHVKRDKRYKRGKDTIGI